MRGLGQGGASSQRGAAPASETSLASLRIAQGSTDDSGSAVIEFVTLGLLLMLPVTYLVLVLGRIQAATFAANGAARESARAFVAASSETEAASHAAVSTGLALRDHGFDQGAGDLNIICAASPCLTPGERVTVEVRITARFPWLPTGFADALNAGVVVSAQQIETVDEFREAGP